MLSTDQDLDVRSLVLYPNPFGPREIEAVQATIRRNSDRYFDLKRAIAEVKKDDGEEKSPAFYVKLGVCMYIVGQDADALATLKKGDGGALAHFYLAKLHMRAGRYEDAELEYSAAQLAGYNSDYCALGRAEAFRAKGDIDESLHELDMLSGAIETTAEYLSQRAATVMAHGETHEAIALYERALDVDPLCVDALFGLALENDRQGNDEDALRYYETAASVFPPRVGVMMNLGILYEDHGRYEDAQYCFDSVLKADPLNQRARLFLKDASSVFDPDSRPSVDERKLSRLIAEFELSQRPRKCLEAIGVKTLGDLIRHTKEELLSLSNFGEVSLREIEALLEREHLKLIGKAPESAEAEDGRDIPDDLRNRPIDELQLSVRARKCMVRADVKTIGELVRKTAEQLMQCKNFGVTSLNEIREKLAVYGLTLQGE